MFEKFNVVFKYLQKYLMKEQFELIQNEEFKKCSEGLRQHLYEYLVTSKSEEGDDVDLDQVGFFFKYIIDD